MPYQVVHGAFSEAELLSRFKNQKLSHCVEWKLHDYIFLVVYLVALNGRFKQHLQGSGFFSHVDKFVANEAIK